MIPSSGYSGGLQVAARLAARRFTRRAAIRRKRIQNHGPKSRGFASREELALSLAWLKNARTAFFNRLLVNSAWQSQRCNARIPKPAKPSMAWRSSCPRRTRLPKQREALSRHRSPQKNLARTNAQRLLTASLYPCESGKCYSARRRRLVRPPKGLGLGGAGGSGGTVSPADSDGADGSCSSVCSAAMP
ncbi:hypothetical protein Pla111_15230 [Botrimarina hoheduenensis]|uniref:Uncharacterized protein n=1 Tax=Botrimarina hoheduenensis TaxID=2528000 RepID=A0A5C5W7L8_9BACT|nr:hypothetical protein Pla111_15230 [Botrimarina hoheduenensis]